jgi:hypothetical protein
METTINTTPLKMEIALLMMSVGRRSESIKEYLQITQDSYNELSEMVKAGRVSYRCRGSVIEMKIARQDHPLIKGFSFKGVEDRDYKLPDYTIQNFSSQTVGDYYN